MDDVDNFLDELVFEIEPEDTGKQGEIRHLKAGANQKAKTALTKLMQEREVAGRINELEQASNQALSTDRV